MTRPYASGTKVTEDRSHFELRTLLRKFGCSETGSAATTEAEILMFTKGAFTYRFTLPMPEPMDAVKTQAEIGRRLSKKVHYSAREALDLERARRLRSLVLLIKAKLIAVEEGISTVEKEFLGQMVTPSGQTVEELWLPEIERAQLEGRMPNTLALPGRSS